MRLEDLQRELAAALTGREKAPVGVNPEALERTRRSLESKRRSAAAHLLPRTRAALGATWAERFRQHAATYAPDGQLHHIDDAWELAETLEHTPDPTLCQAAHDDLIHLRLRYTRDRNARADRIRERRAPLVAVVHTPTPTLIVRGPGAGGRVWTLRWPG
jgi:hypothetical protein